MRTGALPLLTLLISIAAFGCAGDENSFEPAVLNLRSFGVVVPAVDQIEVQIRPELSQMFVDTPDDRYFGGQVTTQISAAGEFVILANKQYVEENFVMGSMDSGFVFEVPLPLYTNAEDNPTIGDPLLVATFIRGVDRIASAAQRISWPILDGEIIDILVRCDASSNVAIAKCNNSAP